MSRVDRILDVIDVGLQRTTEAEYGDLVDADQCWRCRRTLTSDEAESPSGTCGTCREVLLSDDEMVAPTGLDVTPARVMADVHPARSPTPPAV